LRRPLHPPRNFVGELGPPLGLFAGGDIELVDQRLRFARLEVLQAGRGVDAEVEVARRPAAALQRDRASARQIGHIAQAADELGEVPGSVEPGLGQELTRGDRQDERESCVAASW